MEQINTTSECEGVNCVGHCASGPPCSRGQSEKVDNNAATNQITTADLFRRFFNIVLGKNGISPTRDLL